MALPLLGGDFRSVRPYTRVTRSSPGRFGTFGATTSTKPGGWGSTTQTTEPPFINKEAMAAIDRAKALYAPDGDFGAGVEAGLERGRTKALASGAQAMVSAGIAGTTELAGLGKKYEEEVAAPARARVGEVRAGALSNLEVMRAQILQGATESERSAALQAYIARLSADTSLAGAVVRSNQPQQPVTQPTVNVINTGANQPAYKFPSAPSLISGRSRTGMSPASFY